RWRLELPSEIRQFDYDTISDVILHVRYTARDGGARLKQAAASHARDCIARIAPVRLFSMRHEFPSEWARFKSGQELNVDLKPEHYPFWTRGPWGNMGRGPSLVESARSASVSMLARARSSEGQPVQPRVTTKGRTASGNEVTWESKLLQKESMGGL